MRHMLLLPSALCLAVLLPPAGAQPLGTAFTYQGQLTESGQPASGLYDLQACLFDSPSNPVPIACAPDFGDVPVAEGVFTLALDFGSSPFAGQQRFLELRVRPGASTGSYTTLAPRQLIRATPEALRAAAASAAPWSGLTGVPAGFADGIDDTGGAGTVTSITAGTGLSGGTITGSGTIGIANGGVGTAQIATAAVGSAQLAAGAVGRTALADNAVDTAAVQNLAITQAKIAAGAVGSSQLAAGAVGPSQLAPGAVGSAQLAAGAVGLAQINPAQVQARIAGTCAIGEYFRGINADGSVACESIVSFLGLNLITTVDNPANFVGAYTSIAIGTDGLPVISYSDGTANALKVAKCGNAACTGAATITTIDDSSSAGVGAFSSIAIGTDGRPVISYFDDTARALKVAQCSNASCTGTATISTVDHPASGNIVGQHTSIAIGADGRPVISYFDDTADALKVAKCANAACTGAATITTVDDPANAVGIYTSIAIGTDGLPVISYFDETADALKVAKCTNAACSAAAIAVVDDQPVNDVGRFSSIAIGIDGLPVISYRDTTIAALKVARCASLSCSDVSSIAIVDDPADNSVGNYTSIAIGTDGWPVISYHDSSASALKVAKCRNVNCIGDVVITTLDDPPNNVGHFTSIAIGADGLPVISYRDFSANTLKVAKCGTRSCQ
jgi:predicted regulator of Ras-like GTPase activity (Roadblock/LC7/MglB family)